MDNHYADPYFINTHVGTVVYKLRNAQDKILNVNDCKYIKEVTSRRTCV